ncbi:MAG: DEAD/DEAH box helicase [Sphingobacteriia bacterium]|nr:MAG: DEAD/DEAH box helicase [Sphingobacteriia bacterium]
MLFKELQLIEPILAALETAGYSTPTPIQEQAIPMILAGNDLLGCAQTGTGKTAAFAIPILQLVTKSMLHGNHNKGIKALVLTPTRELAIQIEESFKDYGKNLRMKQQVIFGGVSQVHQVNALRNGVDILIATPGRLLDLMQQGYVRLNDIQFFVLDEADRMLDMGFINDVKKIIAKLPVKKQTLFFSATMPDEIEKLSSTLLHNPAKVTVTPVSSTAEKIQQAVYFVEKDHKKLLLVSLLKDAAIQTALVFTRTKHGADKVVKDLTRNNITAEAIHGNKSQNARQRALTNFKNGSTRILVATDIAARGIDIDQLTHVFNYELPNVAETYVHRIGRTGRAGASGIAISFCEAEERAFLKDIQLLIKKQLPVVTDHAYHSASPAPATYKLPERRPAAQQQNRTRKYSFNRSSQNR